MRASLIKNIALNAKTGKPPRDISLRIRLRLSRGPAGEQPHKFYVNLWGAPLTVTPRLGSRLPVGDIPCRFTALNHEGYVRDSLPQADQERTTDGGTSRPSTLLLASPGHFDALMVLL